MLEILFIVQNAFVITGARTEDGAGSAAVSTERSRAEQEESADGGHLAQENVAAVVDIDIVLGVIVGRLPQQRRFTEEQSHRRGGRRRRGGRGGSAVDVVTAEAGLLDRDQFKSMLQAA